MTKTAIFQNSRRRTAAILKIASPYLSRELSDFDQIWYTGANFQFEHGNLNDKSKFFKFKMADGRHTENRFWLYLGAVLADLCKFRNGESHADIGDVTKTAIFANSRWRTAAILKIALSPYLSRELSDFDQIWYAESEDANFHSDDGFLTKIDFFFKLKMADGRHIENRFWLYIGALLAD